MAITKQEVIHLAELARIELTEDEVDKFQKQITSILDYVDKLDKIKVEKGEKIVMSDFDNILRNDIVVDHDNQKSLVDQAPDQMNGQIKVKTILKKDETI